MRMCLLVLVLTVLACGDNVPAPVHFPECPTVSQPMPAPERPKPEPMPTVGRLMLPSTTAQIQGQAVPVGPLFDTATGRSCYLEETGLCVPVDTARVSPEEVGVSIDIDCQTLALKMPRQAPDFFDGLRVWRQAEDKTPIPPGLAGAAILDKSGKCLPQRTIMAGSGWIFVGLPTLAHLIWAKIAR